MIGPLEFRATANVLIDGASLLIRPWQDCEICPNEPQHVRVRIERRGRQIFCARVGEHCAGKYIQMLAGD